MKTNVGRAQLYRYLLSAVQFSECPSSSLVSVFEAGLIRRCQQEQSNTVNTHTNT